MEDATDRRVCPRALWSLGVGVTAGCHCLVYGLALLVEGLYYTFHFSLNSIPLYRAKIEEINIQINHIYIYISFLDVNLTNMNDRI